VCELRPARRAREVSGVSTDDNVISLADRVLGECPGCREPVLFAENFVRMDRAFVHVTCTISPGGPRPRPPREDFPRAAPPPIRGA
jgi:hypothetical protein